MIINKSCFLARSAITTAFERYYQISTSITVSVMNGFRQTKSVLRSLCKSRMIAMAAVLGFSVTVKTRAGADERNS